MVWGRRITQHQKTSRKPHRACCVFVDITFFFIGMSGVQPFQFEPTYPPGEEPGDSEEASGESDSELKESKNREHRLLHL